MMHNNQIGQITETTQSLIDICAGSKNTLSKPMFDDPLHEPKPVFFFMSHISYMDFSSCSCSFFNTKMPNLTSSLRYQLKPNEKQIIESITKILTTPNASLDVLTSFIPTLTNSPSTFLTLLTSPLLARRPHTLLSFFKWTQHHAPSLTCSNPHALLSLLPSLFAFNKFPDAKSLLVSFISSDHSHALHSLLLRHAPQHSKALLDTSIGAYVHCNQPHLAAQVFGKMHKLRVKPNLLTCNTLLGALVRCGSVHSFLLCKGVFRDMVELRVGLNVNTFNILIKGYCGEGSFNEAVELIRRMEPEFGCAPDTISYNTVLDGLCKKGQLKCVRDLLLEMKNAGLVPSRNTYNTLVSGYCKMGWLKDAAKVIELMAQNNILPDVWTYNMLMSGFCREGMIEEAFRLRDEMEKLRLFPDVVSYNTLIDGCFEHKSDTEALKLFEEMGEKGVKPNAVTHNIMIKWFCKQGKMVDAADNVKKMEESGFRPDCFTYNTLFDGYCKVGNFADAFSTINGMLSKGLKIDTCTLNTFLRTLCAEKKLDKAYSLLNSAAKRGYIIDEVSYGTLMTGYFKDEKVDKALNIWDEMKEKNIIPTIVTYNSLIGGLCLCSKTGEAIDKLNELLESGILPDDITYNTIIHGYCKEGQLERAFKFHNNMVDVYSFQPDIYTCNLLLHGLCRDGMLEKALTLFRKWISKGKDIDVVTYNTLISGLCKGGKLEDAFELLKEMEEKKLGPDRYTYNAFFHALTNAGRIKEAEEFRSKIVEMGKLPEQRLQMDEIPNTATQNSQEVTNEISHTFSEQINELCSQEKYKDAMQIFKELKEKGISVNKYTYINLMNGLIKRRKSITKSR